MNLLDGHTVAVDANTGKELWRTNLADINKGETITMAPLVAEGKVLVGNSGGEMGVRGWLTALDAGSGKIAWRAYSTGPDKDALIGPDYRAPYPQDQGKDLGVKSWGPEQWKIGGGTVWGWISYDPELRLVYYGTGNPGPWNAEQRPGDNKWTAGVFARDVTTGEARWFHQSTPHDLFDHDDINETIWSTGRGRMRSASSDAPSEPQRLFLRSGPPQPPQSVRRPLQLHQCVQGRGPEDGADHPGGGKGTQGGPRRPQHLPGPPGAKDWNPSAFSPVTGLIYIPHLNICMDMGVKNANYIPARPSSAPT